MIQEAVHYTRMALGIAAYLHTRPLPDPEGVIRHQLENREKFFLDTTRRVIFSNPQHPYAEMFRLAGCGFEDLERAVSKDGLEAALGVLHRQGVYLTHDEFKGKVPIVRSGRHIPATTASFRNPFGSGLMMSTTSGSRSKGTKAPTSTKLRLYREVQTRLRWRELGIEDRVHLEVKPILPSSTGLGSSLSGKRLGYPVERWFAVGGTLRDSGHYRWATKCMVAVSKALGGGAPFPTYLPANDFTEVAAWIARGRARGASYFVGSYTSPAVRVAAAALENGLDIGGTVFLVAGEALTDAKRAVIEKAGAQVYVSYPVSEAGLVGHACSRMKTGNRVHLFHDSLAVIGHRRRAPLTEVEVDALLFTTLLPFSKFTLINAEMDDSGVIEPVRCDCLFARCGFTRQVRDIFSFGKLTGHGMTLMGTDLLRILEEALPARIGGAPGDYQLVEGEGAVQTQLTLRVSPRVRSSSADKVKECFLKELGHFYGGALAARMWSHAEGLDVVIAEPLSTVSGKVLPLHLLGTGVGKTYAS
jgi:hypothetical protein